MHLTHLLLSVLSLSAPAQADVAPPPSIHAVPVRNILTVQGSAAHAFFLVAFPGSQFKSSVFAIHPFPVDETKTLQLCLQDMTLQGDHMLPFLYNHAYMVALSAEQQHALAALIAAHPGLQGSGSSGAAADLSASLQITGFSDEHGQAIDRFLRSDAVLRLDSPLTCQVYAREAQDLQTHTHQLSIVEGQLLHVVTSQ